MQDLLKKLRMKASVETVYVGPVFTIAKASVSIDSAGNIVPYDTPFPPVRIVIGEGIARRSNLDKPSEVVGRQIAEGRALKALQMKIDGGEKAVPRFDKFMG